MYTCTVSLYAVSPLCNIEACIKCSPVVKITYSKLIVNGWFLVLVGQTAVGIDVDCFTQYFYWTDVSGKAISRAQLDGTDSSVIVRGKNTSLARITRTLLFYFAKIFIMCNLKLA